MMMWRAIYLLVPDCWLPPLKANPAAPFTHLRAEVAAVKALMALPRSRAQHIGKKGLPTSPSRNAVDGRGLTLVHFSPQRKQVLWDTLGTLCTYMGYDSSQIGHKMAG